MHHFFILGLPRSRTAWLANWFTQGRSLCLHDASRYAADPFDLRRLFSGRSRYRYAGTSDSANVLWFDGLREEFPGARFLIVRRDTEESVLASEAAGFTGCREKIERAAERHERILEEHPTEVRALDYDKITERALQKVQAWLTPTEPFDALRYHQLDELRVTIHMGKYNRLLEV